jgi:hypothetical protein
MKGTLGVIALAATFVFGAAGLVDAASSKKSGMTHDTKPGPAFQTVDGKLNKIDGSIYVVEDYTGKEMRLYVSKDTKKLKGEKKPGDLIRAEITKGGHANSIQ